MSRTSPVRFRNLYSNKMVHETMSDEALSDMMPDVLSIRALGAADAPELSAMLRAQRAEYARFFHPFGFDERAVESVLAKSERDVYSAIYLEGQLVVFFMLRGWDDGFDVPAFGVLVDEKHRGSGLEMLSLDVAKTICRLRGARRIMLKMHPENISTKAVARKIGFVFTREDGDTGNLIYHYDLA